MSQLQLPKLRKIDPNKPKKKKILLLSDDLRMHSGIATMSREFVLGTMHEYDWVQLAAAVKHPNENQIIDISADAAAQTGVEDAYLKLYAVSGYGNEATLQQVMNLEKPDAILHFTDPRFWDWLYQIEHSIRQRIPLMYYNIWDDLPYPHWNEPFYESCDLIMNISRQTQNIVTNVLKKFPKPDWAVQWVPHGINEKNFRPLTELDPDWEEYNKFADDFKNKHGVEFIVFWNNRNIRRKQPGDVILAYNDFCRRLTKEQAQKTCLLMHTQAVDPNGTDLYAVASAMAPDYKVFFTDEQISVQQLNFLYNMAAVTVNIASNEGFGLSHAESLMAGTPIINNVTGGLQDGCRFEDEDGKWIEFTTEFPSNHTGVYRKHGVWARPVFPTSRSLQGSPPTPYIFDDRVEYKDVADAIMYWYSMSPEERNAAGLAGREWVTGDESNFSARRMSERFIQCITECFEKWTPRKRFTMYTIGKKHSYEFEKVGVL
jgi:glycosyltransferase involved in cell wall biosynthesis